jgi:uncharacterized protein DUF2752
MLGAGLALPALPGHPGLPCPLRAVTGVPCPFCGMTTSVEATVHLRLGDALAANPAGLVLVAVALWILVRRPASMHYSLPLIWAAVAAMWLFQLHRFAFI